MPEGPAIVLDSVCMRFGDGPLVLDAIRLEVRPGEIVSFVGPSGCGKSTLLRLVAGLLKPTAGTIRHEGANPSPAFIFQDATLLPWARVVDNIALPLRLQGMDANKRRARAMEWARRLGLEAAADYHPRQLSGGMRMRASIARALCMEPNLLLLDEPFGALDAITRNRLNEEILALHERDRWTALFVTHSVSEAVFLSHRVVILGQQPGRVAHVMEIPIPFPRDARTRESLAFQQCLAEATGQLRGVLA